MCGAAAVGASTSAEGLGAIAVLRLLFYILSCVVVLPLAASCDVLFFHNEMVGALYFHSVVASIP